jgi:hypothetical protein
MIEAFEEYDRSVNIGSVTKISCHTSTHQHLAEAGMLLTYERPEKTVITDLVVAEWLHSITNPDSRMLLENR